MARTKEYIKEMQKAAHKRRYANPEYRAKILAQNKSWADSHKESSRKRSLKWRNANIEFAREKCRQWFKNNLANRVEYESRRRAKKLKVTVNPKSIQKFIEGVRAKRTVVCYYCRKRTSGKSVHFDHMIPLSKGGSHSVENLCATCQHCNQTKFTKSIREWMKLGQQLLDL